MRPMSSFRRRSPLSTRWSLALLSCGALAALTACRSGGEEPDTSDTEVGATETETEASADGDTGTDTGTDTPACAAQTAGETMACVDGDLYTSDLGFIADIRVPGSTHWQAVQDMCTDRLMELGFEVELHDYGSGVNVIGTLPGTNPDAGRVIIGAHYDHLEDCTGADDNATGVAAVLEIARVLAEVETPGTLVVACWDEEELGLLGSDAHVQRDVDVGDSESIVAAFAFDMIGYTDDEPGSQSVPDGFDFLFPTQYAELEANEFRGDFLFWISDDAMTPLGVAFDGFAATLDLPTLGASLDNDLKKSPLLADLRRSDHASFWDRDLPGMFFNDSANFRYASYHCLDGGDDLIANLDLPFAVDVTKAATATIAVALGRSAG